MIENKHRCPKNIWQTFTGEGKLRYNNIMDKALHSQELCIHPAALEMPEVHWWFLCHTFAMMAAYNHFDIVYQKQEPANVFTTAEKLINLGYGLQ